MKLKRKENMTVWIRKCKVITAENKYYQFIRQNRLEETSSIPQHNKHQVLPCRKRESPVNPSSHPSHEVRFILLRFSPCLRRRWTHPNTFTLSPRLASSMWIFTWKNKTGATCYKQDFWSNLPLEDMDSWKCWQAKWRQNKVTNLPLPVKLQPFMSWTDGSTV